MTIYRNHNAGAMALAGGAIANTIFNSSMIPGTGVCAYHLNITGQANDVANVTRQRIKAAGQTFWDITMGQLQALYQRLGRANLAPAAGDVHWSLPLLRLDSGDNMDLKYAGGFPKGLAPTVEIETDAATAAGTLLIGWTQSDQPFTYYPKFLGSQANITGAAVNGRVPITQDGLIYGFTIDTTNLVRVKVKISGIELLNMTVQQLLAQQDFDATEVVVDPLFVQLPYPIAAVGGDSYFELDVGAGWLPAAEIAVFSILPNA